MSSPRGILFLALFLLLIGGGEYIRIHSGGKALEMESPSLARGTLVFLGEGFPEKGIHHFYDDPTPQSVIQMTLPEVLGKLGKNSSMNIPLHSGEGLELLLENDKLIEIKRFWTPSETRMALFIPLHPDRMSVRDWEALPGIGPKLAVRIEKNRQINGDFGCLENLKRVKGIGDGLLQRLQIIF